MADRSLCLRAAVAGVWACALLLAGCASPGPPRPPSLHLPEPVANLTAARVGDAVELRFTLPQRTTDDLPIREPNVVITLCRGPESATCLPVPAFSARELPIADSSGALRSVVWQDPLPPALTTGDPRPLVYRMELRNAAGRSSGWSAPAYAAAGATPPTVSGFTAQGTRKGVLLQWQPVPNTQPGALAEVLLRRDRIGPPPQASPTRASSEGPLRPKRSAPAATVWLEAHGASDTLDGSAEQNVQYRYSAVRRRVVELDGRKLELRSAASAPVEITWRDIFPPPVPTGLSAAPFTEAGHFAVDLVWNPVQDPGLAGYNITRQPIDAQGAPLGAAQKLNSELLTLPAFHDASAEAGVRYRYSVTAVDNKENESAGVAVIVEPVNTPQ